jgi:regulator of protease activity HflC (stomatin/prohibitin superfamily)
LATVFATLLAVLAAWTSLHVVSPGTVGIPVTLGHPTKALRAGLHITWPFTSVSTMTSRTQNYSMTSHPNEGARANTDDSVAVLGSDGSSASVNATVLFRLDTARATEVYRTLGTGYANAVVRPHARTCIRSQFTRYPTVAAATTEWQHLQALVATCMKDKIEPRGLILEDFQLREVALGRQLQNAVNSKVASQQNLEQQMFERATAQQLADVTRIQALATADAQQILACGGQVSTKVRNGQLVKTVTPNAITFCSQTQLTPQYLQFTYIQALKQLVNSPNNSTVILPFDKTLTPLIDASSK